MDWLTEVIQEYQRLVQEINENTKHRDEIERLKAEIEQKILQDQAKLKQLGDGLERIREFFRQAA